MRHVWDCAPHQQRRSPRDERLPECARNAPSNKGRVVDPAYPLYDSAFEHDNCGTGFVVDVSGKPSHLVVERALEALANLAHRGAMDADTGTSDGAGLLTQVPVALLHAWLRSRKIEIPAQGKLGVGMVFLPQRAADAERGRHEANEVLARRGMLVLGWRKVPLDAQALGRSARRSLPRIEQVLARIPDDMLPAEAERQLYLARKETERRCTEQGVAGLYTASMSARTIVYKGLVSAGNLPMLYPDLQQTEYESALAIFHQRYSTNTFPSWPLAQPMRLLAHNGEINTIRGNRSWMRAHEADLKVTWQADAEWLSPIIEPGGSDSASLDNALDLLVHSGRELPNALALLVPEAWEGNDDLASAIRDFFRVRAPLMGPWDGPAALIFSDGRYVGAMLDRNGLRPMRYVLTDDGTLVVASEAGVVDLLPSSIIEKGRLGPGHMLVVDTLAGRLWRNTDLKAMLAAQHPYGMWSEQRIISGATDNIDQARSASMQHDSDDALARHPDDLPALQTLFGYSHEDVELILRPMLTERAEAIWSMGDDTPLAVLARHRRPLAAYFRQRFAQVTNPPIDPLRERLVMSLSTYLGARSSCLTDAEPVSPLIELSSPILDGEQLRVVLATAARHGIKDVALSTTYSVNPPEVGENVDAPEQSMRDALDSLGQRAVGVVAGGVSLLVLSDRNLREHEIPLPQPLAIAAVHEALLAAGLRLRTGMVVETGAAWDVHSVALLLGYGANAVLPYLALQSASAIAGTRGAETLRAEQAAENYQHALEKGLCKVLSRMGLSTLESYIGGQQFECIGVDEELVARYFPGTPTSLGGLSLAALAEQVRAQAAESAVLTLAAREACAATSDATPGSPSLTRMRLKDRGLVRFRKDGEYHAANPHVVNALQRAAETGASEDYAAYTSLVAARQATAIRDLLTFKRRHPIALEQVEPVESIVARFITSAMSLGSLSPEAHLTLTLGANMIGARSNTGEGGEDPDWRHAQRNGVKMSSRVKQVASGRFGVTTDYLVQAEELEIKMAQGSKPGEGGQIPSRKVTELIARLRHTTPGTQLISPPPHHDIYSIEDLAQLIYDLRQVNPRAAVGVKLVAERGVGTIAAGVAKAHADYVLISGHDGGTGASPLGSIKNVGIPWELGLAEAQQVLRINRLRSRVRVRVDGGLKNGRDVVVAALLGADEFGFGTAALISIGCDMARQCHLDTCPTGIATQREDLRRRFTGTPEQVAHYLLVLAEEVRRILAKLGVRSLDEAIVAAPIGW